MLRQATSGLTVQTLNVSDKVRYLATPRTVVPFSSISDASDLARQSNGATFGDVVLLTPKNTLTKQFRAMSHFAYAFVNFLEINAMFKSTSLYQIPIRNIGIV